MLLKKVSPPVWERSGKLLAIAVIVFGFQFLTFSWVSATWYGPKAGPASCTPPTAAELKADPNRPDPCSLPLTSTGSVAQTMNG